MAHNFWITFIRKIVNESHIDGIEKVQVYIFGSAVSQAKPNDIDILLVYSKNELDIDTAIQIRCQLKREVENYTALKADICLLSTDELISSKFAEQENAIRVFPSIDR